tara:strand:+ start:206 stop:787 length:582 start_codon:yes stop_codon:yes gene_type:complete
MNSRIKKCLSSSVENFTYVLNDTNIHTKIEKIIDLSIKAFRNDKKMLFCGNGGSASDAQHIAAELSGKFYIDRPPLNAEALHVNSSFITAVANDYGYDEIYSRMVQASGRAGDILVGISTSGNSTNVIKAIKKAKEIGIITIGFTGNKIGDMDSICDVIIKAPTNDTPRVQEIHILIGHIICEMIEEKMFPNA